MEVFFVRLESIVVVLLTCFTFFSPSIIDVEKSKYHAIEQSIYKKKLRTRP